MPQTRLHLTIDESAARAAFAILEPLFEEDGVPVALFKAGNGNGPGERWCVSIYADEADARAIAARAASALGSAGLPTSLERELIEDADWMAQTLRELAPVRAGRFIVHGSHDHAAPRANDWAVTIDAGLAFGTGHHGTTAGCLEALSHLLRRGRLTNVLDVGTGSGVLAIAAARATNAAILATDIDPVAVQVAMTNARLNGVGSRIRALTAPGFGHRDIAGAAPFDLIMANILANPLRAMARDLTRHTAQGGTVILSGLLPNQRTAIAATYRSLGLRFERATVRDGWLTLVLRN